MHKYTKLPVTGLFCCKINHSPFSIYHVFQKEPHMLTEMGRRARAASKILALASTAAKDRVLLTLADLLDSSRSEVKAANAKDISAAQASGLTEALIDRL